MSLLRSDNVFNLITIAASCLAGIIVLMIIVFIGTEALPTFEVGISKFFFDPAWDPSSHQYNLIPMVIGSILVTMGAIMIAFPIALLAAIFCEISSPITIGSGTRTLIEVLAGVPSVIYGFWGVVAVIPILYHLSPPGANILAGCIVLATMILPTLAILFMNSLKSIPPDWILGGEALGLSSGSLAFKVIIPGIKPQLSIGVLVALGRAIGETMAVLMVCGNIVKVPLSLFDPIRTLTSNIALEMAYAMDHHRAALFASGMILLLVVSVLTTLTHWQQREGRVYARR